MDRGELEKIIERSNQYYGSNSQPDYSSKSQQPKYEQKTYENNYNKKDDTQYNHKKKRGGFLEDIFDFG